MNMETVGTKLRILLLEDSSADKELICEKLTDAGFVYVLTHTVKEEEFVTALNQQQFDIILSDYKLPGYDAFGALHACNSICPGVPFICLSGTIGEETAIDLLKQGAVDYVLKDRSERLPHAIKRALDEAKEKAAHQKAIKDLQESENRFKQVAESTLEWIWQVDQKGLYTYTNQVVTSLLGYTPDEIIGKRYFYDFFVPEQKEELKKAAFDAFEKKESFRNFVNPNVHKNGQIVILSTSGTAIRDESDNFAGFMGVDADITEQNRAVERIRLLSRAIESSSISIVITDARGNIMYTNPFFSSLTGFTAEEAAGQNPRILQSGHQLIEFYKELWDTILSGRDWEGEFKNRKKNGDLYWENAIISPIVNDDCKITHFVAIKEDITERKRIHEELVAAKEKAEESNRLKTAFLQNMSHEIRTPMNGILGFIDLLKKPNLSGEERSNFMDIVNKSGQRLLTTINDIIEISKIESGNVDLHLTKENIHDLINTHYTFFLQEMKKRGLTFSFSNNQEDAEFIMVDKPKFDGILVNLISNAMKFTLNGSIEIGYHSENGFLVFHVKDTGIGIPADKHETIFERFVQADSTITRGYEGSGLGLAICKAYIELMGGRIWIDSIPGRGTTFFFTLPFNRANQNTNRPVEKPVEKPLHFSPGIKVLIAEDDEVSYLLLETLLTGSGVIPVHVYDGEQAVLLAKSTADISMILMDLKMPVLNGLEATRLIRQFNKEIPIVALTAYAFPADKALALEAGCNDFVSKPVYKHVIISLIQRYAKPALPSYKAGDKKDKKQS